jgi:hypothetical protein
MRRSSVPDQHARVKPAAADRWTEYAHLGGPLDGARERALPEGRLPAPPSSS